MTWNTIAIVWLLLSAAGTVIITVGIAVWVLRHYNQDIRERESVQKLEPDQNAQQDAPHSDLHHNGTHQHDSHQHDIQQNTPHHDPS